MTTLFDIFNVSRRDVPGSYVIHRQYNMFYAKSLVEGKPDLQDLDKNKVVQMAFNILDAGMIWIKQEVGALTGVAFNNPKVLVFQELDGILHILNGSISPIQGTPGPPGPPGITGGSVMPVGYEVYFSTTYKARNGLTGNDDYSDPSAGTTIQNAITNA